MVQIQLEFRGIRFEHLVDYFKELGGIQETDSFPIHIKGDRWNCSLLKEEEIKITSSFLINAVEILFQAETEEILEILLKNFRKKTTRIGG
ncbi:hypothetical protein ACNQFZ_01595 [Schinkia sp. CFF1]